MAEEIKDLIAKIQQEGVNAAEAKARQIEAQAREQAAKIIADAKLEAEKKLAEAQETIQKSEAASKISLTQAGRNLLISLRKEINAQLDKILALNIKEALSPSELTKILHSIISESSKQDKGNIVISLSKHDLEKLDKAFLSELKEEVKKGVTLKASDEISSGFMISFDAGKSCFDFSDKALVEYIAQQIKPELAKLLKE